MEQQGRKGIWQWKLPLLEKSRRQISLGLLSSSLDFYI
jgi:hypothetical protein